MKFFLNFNYQVYCLRVKLIIAFSHFLIIVITNRCLVFVSICLSGKAGYCTSWYQVEKHSGYVRPQMLYSRPWSSSTTAPSPAWSLTSQRKQYVKVWSIMKQRYFTLDKTVSIMFNYDIYFYSSFSFLDQNSYALVVKSPRYKLVHW